MNFRKLSLLLLAAAAFYSCRTAQKSEEPTKEAASFSRGMEMADSCWQAMMASDDGKISNMQRLLDELMLIDGADSMRITTLKKEAGKLSALRYDRRSMGEKGRIDQYDSLCTALITAIRQEVSRNPKAIEFQIVNQLVSEVSQADDSVLFYRKEYDRSVDSVNFLLKNKRNKLRKSFPGIDSLSPFPVFRLIP